MTIEDRLDDIIRQLLGDDTLELADDANFEALPKWDSINQINLMFAIEQQLGVRFNGSEIFDFETVGQLKRFAIAKLAAASIRVG